MFYLLSSIGILFIESSSRFTSEMIIKKVRYLPQRAEVTGNGWPSNMGEGLFTDVYRCLVNNIRAAEILI